MEQAYVNSDNAVWFVGGETLNIATGARTALDGTATVTCRVQTPDHVDIAGTVWPVTMTYLVGSQGYFLGLLPDTLAWVAGQTYRLIVLVEAGPGQKRTYDVPLHVLVSQE